MKHLTLILLSSVFLAFPLLSKEAVAEQYDYLIGSYECVGRWPDSNKTYSGRVQITEGSNGVKMVRTINGHKISPVAKYETATADNIEVLRVRFTQKGRDYEETCMVSGDLDNYARITCYMYTKGTQKVGLETLFPDYGQMTHKYGRTERSTGSLTLPVNSALSSLLEMALIWSCVVQTNDVHFCYEI